MRTLVFKVPDDDHAALCIENDPPSVTYWQMPDPASWTVLMNEAEKTEYQGSFHAAFLEHGWKQMDAPTHEIIARVVLAGVSALLGQAQDAP